jgi:hypothetical protein
MQNFEVAESDDDFNLQETMLRAQLEALANALGEVSAVVVGFVERSGSA